MNTMLIIEKHMTTFYLCNIDLKCSKKDHSNDAYAMDPYIYTDRSIGIVVAS